MKRIFCVIFALLLCASVFACGDKSESETSEGDSSVVEFEQISQAEAKKIMDSGEAYFLIDSRTQSEFDEGHIAGAVMIPEYEIKSSLDKLPSDKNTLILVYCRSGRRSKIAAQALCELGYTNVKEFGGIITWEYGIVK